MSSTSRRKTGRFLFTIAGVVVGTAILFSPLTVPAQGLALEEVIVTAQRRVQSLQEVPISLDVFTGEDLNLQGFRNFEDMAKFSPSITVTNGREQLLTIRGFGTQGNRVTLQSATPMFVDGIHFGRRELSLSAFMDVERVEILKGPQPIHFGMSATAGAINVMSKRPTPEWEADLASEIGNFGHVELTGALSGPLTDTLGIRVAGAVERSDGPVKHRVTNENYPKFDSMGGRVMLEWTPSEKFNLLGKFELTQQDNGGDLLVGCLTEGQLTGFRRDSPIFGTTPLTTGNQLAVLAPPPKGLGFAGIVYPEQKGKDCFEDAVYGEARQGPWLEPDQRIFGYHNSGPEPGLIDFRDVIVGYTTTQGPEGPGPNGMRFPGGHNGLENAEYLNTWNALIDATYRLENGISINSQTGTIENIWLNPRGDCCLFVTSASNRIVRSSQWSQMLRVEAPAEGYDVNIGVPGGLNVNLMAGGHWQIGDMDAHLVDLRSDFNQAQRYAFSWEDSEWFAGFWNMDLNFLDKQLSLSVGGRYGITKKEVFVQTWNASFIFEGRPCEHRPATNPTLDDNPATCPLHADFKQVNPNLTTPTTFDAINNRGGTRRIDSPRFFVDLAGVNMNDLWTSTSSNIFVPLNWRTADADAVGITAPVYQPLVIGDCDFCTENPVVDENKYDSQVVLSYTPEGLDGNHTFYGKYVTAYKSGAVNVGLTAPPAALADLLYLPETVKAWEFGTKGMLFDSRVRYDLSAFRSQFTDLQTEGVAPIIDPLARRVALNAGEQLVKGIEFSTTMLVTQDLVFNLGGALMDGKMVELDGGGCTGDETVAASANAVNNPAGRSAAELTLANTTLNALSPERRAHALAAVIPEEFLLNGGCRLEAKTLPNGGTRGAGTFNRSGDDAPRTPDWNFVYGLTYTRPFLDQYQMLFDIRGKVSAGYINDLNHSRLTAFDTHADLSVSSGIESQDGTWSLIAYARNLLEAAPQYHEEYDFLQLGFTYLPVSETQFTMYGLRFEYRFR